VALIALASLLLAVIPAPALAQQLTYKTHIQIRKLPLNSADSLRGTVIDQAGRGLRETVLVAIEGSAADFTIVVGDGAVRIENESDRTVEIIRHDRHTVLNPVAKTYWTLPNRPRNTSLPGLDARLSWKRTGELETIAGVQAERIVFEIAMIPADQGFAKMLGEPIMFGAEGEVWVAAQYSRYTRMAAAIAPQVLAVFPTLAELGEHGAILRSTIVSELLGPAQIESVVTQISEDPVAAVLFEAPASYRKVSPPPAKGYEAPQLLSRSPANYSSEAAREKIDGVVVLLVTVAANGSVQNPRILKGIGYGLDEEAIKSVLQWRYTPARKAGQPIDSQVTISVGFAYRERSR
jgi:TonB family protein